ncbi:MAG: hypothetical protein NVS3B10_05500 [Polyangiales bacterium]
MVSVPQHPSAMRLLLSAGLLTWTAVVGTSASQVLGRGPLAALPWAIALVVFAIAFAWAVAFGPPESARAARIALLGAQSAAALVVVVVSRTSTASALFAVAAAQAAFVLSGRASAALVAVQTLALSAIYVRRWGGADGAMTSTSFLAFQLFALGVGRLAEREATARTDVARINAELMAAREILAEATRTAERLRIARELHDSLGHHLTALSLDLELARNVSEGRARSAVERAQGMARALLGEVREAVTTLREDEPMDLTQALERLARGTRAPVVHLALPARLLVPDRAVAHALFRCAQEAITNAVRHADASNLWLDLASTADAFVVVVRDDGRGADVIAAGHGLTGLRERVEGLGGRLSIESRAGSGVTLRASIPAPGRAPSEPVEAR